MATRYTVEFLGAAPLCMGIASFLQQVDLHLPDDLQQMRSLCPVLLVLMSLLTGLGCASPPQTQPTDTYQSASQSWVTVYDPNRSWNGYTLAFYAHRIPILLDMNGRIVHRWPDARVKSRVRLLEDGSLLAIALGRGVVEYDWDGNRVWEYEAEHGFAHHDVIRLDNGNTMTLIRPDEGRFDDIVEVDPAGNVVWNWSSGDYLEPFILPAGSNKTDVTHMNSIQELPDNPWFDRGDERFRPGNLLVSAREMNLVFIIDKQSRQLVWTFDADLDKQHEPLMIGPESPGAGNILIFNNRYRSFYNDRQSTILEINPSSDTLVWQYRSAGFYSPTSGVEQSLPNGNILITSSRGGRTFEITRGGRIVWEWAPPFDTTRSQRYDTDHSPQLAALGPPRPLAVEADPGYQHIDTDVYRFARRGLRRDIQLGGKRMSVLKYNNDCRDLVLPAGAQVEISYGLDSRRLADQGRGDYAARFLLTVRDPGSGEVSEVFEDVVRTADTWRSETLDLQRFALQKVALCIATEEVGAAAGTTTEEFARWQQPLIETPRPGTPIVTEDDLSLGELTPEELETRKKHLEALGYIN